MSQNEVSNETKLMLYCARVTMDSSIQNKLQEILQSPLDWKSVIEQSYYHEISPLIYDNINKVRHQTVSHTATFALLENAYYATSVKNMLLWRNFCFIQDILNKAGIKVIPLKGIILSETLYHNLGLRPMADIDVLVQEKELLKSKNELLQLGYKIYLKNLPEDYWRKYQCHLQFYNPDKEITLELHWAFAPPRPNKLNLNDIWKRSGIQVIDNIEILTLSLEDTLLSLFLHICKNISTLQCIKLKNLCDINELIFQYNHKLDWEYIIEKIKSWNIKGATYYIYLLTRKYLDTPWPT